MLLTTLQIACKLLRYSDKPCAKFFESWQVNTYKSTPSLTHDMIILHVVEFVVVLLSAFEAFYSF